MDSKFLGGNDTDTFQVKFGQVLRKEAELDFFVVGAAGQGVRHLRLTNLTAWALTASSWKKTAGRHCSLVQYGQNNEGTWWIAGLKPKDQIAVVWQG